MFFFFETCPYQLTNVFFVLFEHNKKVWLFSVYLNEALVNLKKNKPQPHSYMCGNCKFADIQVDMQA